MAVQTLLIAPNEVVEAIAQYAVRPEESEFLRVPLGNGSFAKIHPYPLRASREIRTKERDFVRQDDSVYRLTLPEELGVLASLSTADLPLRHVYLVENKAAAYSNEGEPYKQNVLVPYWTRTGQVIWTSSDTALRKVLALPTASTDNPTGQLITVDRNSPNGYAAKQVVIPTKIGFFTTVSGDIPVDDEISPTRPDIKEVGYWNGNYPDENGLSAVWCVWYSVGRGLGAGADGPLGRRFFLVLDYCGALGIGTDAPLNK